MEVIFIMLETVEWGPQMFAKCVQNNCVYMKAVESGLDRCLRISAQHEPKTEK